MAKNLFFIVFYIFVIYKADADEKCNRTPLNTPSSVCGTVTEGQVGLDSFKKRSLVDSVNANRRHNADDATLVEWNDRLAEIAQSWANECTTSEIPRNCLPLNDFIVFHLLIYKGSEAKFPHDVVKNIWNQEKVINPPNQEHKVINKVGCGLVVASNGNYLVCIFGL